MFQNPLVLGKQSVALQTGFNDDYVVPHKLKNSELGEQFNKMLQQF